MTQLRMTDDDEILIENNAAALTDHNDDEEIAQRLRHRLKSFYGEWFLDLTRGVPYFQLIFVKGTPPEIIESSFKDVIIGTEGVDSLLEFEPLDLDVATRKLSVKFKVRTINGNPLTINEVLP